MSSSEIMQENELVTQVTQVLKNLLPADQDFIPLHEPSIYGNEVKYVTECVATGSVSSVGKYVDKFERELTDFCGVERAIAVVNGTAALHICLQLVGVQAGDEVLCPTLTFIATANAISYCGAQPNFFDSDELTLGPDIGKLRDYLAAIAEVKNGMCYNKKSGRRISALTVVHTYGHPADMDPLLEICNRYHIPVVEDAAESLGSYYKGRHTGNKGLISCFSFNGNKTITTGGGGAIVTNDTNLGNMAKHLTTTAKLLLKWEFYHDKIGYNYRMPNLNAALGCAQIENLPELVYRKRLLAHRYRDAFKPVPGIRFFEEPEFAKSNYWLNTLILDSQYAHMREALLEETNSSGIMTRPVWTLMHKLPMYTDCPKAETTTAEDLEKRILNIPSSPSLAD